MGWNFLRFCVLPIRNHGCGPLPIRMGRNFRGCVFFAKWGIMEICPNARLPLTLLRADSRVKRLMATLKPRHFGKRSRLKHATSLYNLSITYCNKLICPSFAKFCMS